MPKITTKEDFARYAEPLIKIILNLKKPEDAAHAVDKLHEEWGLIIHGTQLLESIGIDAFLLEVEDHPRLCGVMSKQGLIVLDASNDEGSDVLPFVEVLRHLSRHSSAIEILRRVFSPVTPNIDAIDVSLEPKGGNYGPN